MIFERYFHTFRTFISIPYCELILNIVCWSSAFINHKAEAYDAGADVCSAKELSEQNIEANER
jgi:hypothetical protein